MLNIIDINNNADSIRVNDHRTQYNKNDLLYAAERVKNAKHANINRRGGRIALSHNIGCNGVINHKQPRKMRHKLFIECCIDEYGNGWNWFIENEYYSNIIVVDSRDFCGINSGDYSELYENIVKYVSEYDALRYALEDVKNNVRDREYKTMRAAILDCLGVDVTAKQAARVRAIVSKATTAHYLNYYNEYDRAAELLTALTPHKWEAVTLRGCCQRDVITAIYPADVYSDADIKEYECYFFGMYNEYNVRYNDYAVTYYYSMCYDTDDIINDIAADFGIDPNAVVYNSCY